MVRASVFGLLGSLVIGCAPESRPTPSHAAALADSIHAQMGALAAAISARDLAAVVAFREDSAFVSAAGGILAESPAASAAATHAFYGTLREASFRWDTILVDVLAPDIALAAATWTFTATDTTGAPMSVGGAETYVWRRQTDGAWRIRQQHESYR